MTVQERHRCWGLERRVAQRGLLRGNRLERRRVCGKPSCKCTRGEPHTRVNLVFSDGGRLRQHILPKNRQAVARKWVRNCHDARRLLEEISRRYWEEVRQRQD